MLHIQIICVGKTKEKYFTEAENEYIKRLSPYAKVSFTVVESESSQEKTAEIEKEGERILAQMKGDSFVVAMDQNGKEMASEEFAGYIEKNGIHGKITFVIGGPHGLSQAVLARCNAKISFSRMTFTHQMIRIFLLEQLYRGFTISTGKKYHY